MEVNFIKQIVSSTYLFHNNMSLDNVGIILSTNENDSSNNEKIHRLMLPYQGDRMKIDEKICQ